MAYAYGYGYGIRTGMMASQLYAASQLRQLMDRVSADGGIMQSQTYPYEWYKLDFELGQQTGTSTGLGWRRKYNALGGVKLNGISNTNLVTWSQDATQATWTRTTTTVVTHPDTYPDGYTTAQIATQGAAGFVRNNGITSVTAGATVTGQFLVKRGNNDWLLFQLGTNSASDAGAAWINLSTGALGTVSNVGTATGTVANVRALGNGYHLLSITTAVPTVTQYFPILYAVTADGVFTRPASATYIFTGNQLQTGAIATDYIPTTSGTASATQNYVQTWYDFENTSPVNAIQSTAANQPYYGLDSSLPSNVRGLTFDGSNDVMSVADLGIFNAQAAGTLIASVKDANRTGGDASHRTIFINGATGNSRSLLGTRTAGGNNIAAQGRRLDADASTGQSFTASFDGLNYLVGSFVWGGNLIQLNLNGSAITSGTFVSGAGSTSATDSTIFNIGAESTASNRLQGIITDIAAGRIVLTSAQLAAFRALERSFYPALP